MEAATATEAAARAQGRRKFVIIAALFFLPVALSFALYYGKLWRPSQTSNHGVLITPVVPLQGIPSDLPLQGKWSLVYIGDGTCDAACQDTLVFGRQVRLTLNNEMTRVQRIFLATSNCCNTAYLQSQHPGLLVRDLTSADGEKLLAQFPDIERARTLFIVDPLGNLMMRYDTRQPPKGLQSDLKKLLKLSHIG